MAYQTGTINGVSEWTQMLRDFFMANPDTEWQLVRESDEQQCVVSHKMHSYSIGFNAKLKGQNDGDKIVVSSGDNYVGSAFPGIVGSSEMPTNKSAGGGGKLTWPRNYHIVCSDTYFFIFLIRHSDNDVLASGGCLMDGVGSYAGNVGHFLTTYGGLGNNSGYWGWPWCSRYSAGLRGWPGFPYACCGLRHNGVWRACGDDSESYPRFSAPMEERNNAKLNIYTHDTVKQMRMDLSATAVFLPMILAVHRGGDAAGYEVAYDAPQLRVCNTTFLGNGDIVEYQGRKWIVFKRRNDSDQMGVALQLSVGD